MWNWLTPPVCACYKTMGSDLGYSHRLWPAGWSSVEASILSARLFQNLCPRADSEFTLHEALSKSKQVCSLKTSVSVNEQGMDSRRELSFSVNPGAVGITYTWNGWMISGTYFTDYNNKSLFHHNDMQFSDPRISAHLYLFMIWH